MSYTAHKKNNQATTAMVAVLITASAIYPLGMNIFVPSMPSMVGYFNSTTASVQLILSLYLFSSAVAMLIVGPISDRLGRRPVLIAGFILFLLGSITSSFAPTLQILLLGRIVQAVGGAAGMIMSRAIIRDIYAREQAASMLGYVTMAMAVAPMLGPLIGGSLHELFGWRSVFHFLTLAGAIVLVLAWLYQTETIDNNRGHTRIENPYASYGILFKYKVFWLFSTTNLFCSCIFFSFLGGAPFVTEELLGMTPSEYGSFFIFVAAGYMTGNFLTGRFSIRFGINILITCGNILALLGVSAIAIFFALGFLHPMALFGPMFFVGIANGLTLPNAMAGLVSVRPDLAGAASGLGSSMQITMGAIATVLIGWLLGGIIWPGTIWPLIMFMSVAGMLTLVMGLLAFRADK